MTTEISPVEGIVNTIISLGSEKMQLSSKISSLEETIHQSAEWTELQELKANLVKVETRENELRDTAKQQMIEKDLKKIVLLNGMTVQLDATPGALSIEDESKVPDEYFKEKITRSIDKIKLKEDIKQGVYVEGVEIKQDFKFVIKSI